VFPLENANAPGGPDESDLINEPTDTRFVISRLLQANSAGSGPLAGLIDSTHIAVTGQSDGGETALAVAYSRDFRDPRVGAAVILSGAEMSGVGGFSFPQGSPPRGPSPCCGRCVRYARELGRVGCRPQPCLVCVRCSHRTHIRTRISVNDKWARHVPSRSGRRILSPPSWWCDRSLPAGSACGRAALKH
jgi:hypothetical protein